MGIWALLVGTRDPDSLFVIIQLSWQLVRSPGRGMGAWAQMRPASQSSLQIGLRKIARGCGKNPILSWVHAYCSFVVKYQEGY